MGGGGGGSLPTASVSPQRSFNRFVPTRNHPPTARVHLDNQSGGIPSDLLSLERIIADWAAPLLRCFRRMLRTHQVINLLLRDTSLDLPLCLLLGLPLGVGYLGLQQVQMGWGWCTAAWSGPHRSNGGHTPPSLIKPSKPSPGLTSQVGVKNRDVGWEESSKNWWIEAEIGFYGTTSSPKSKVDGWTVFGGQPMTNPIVASCNNSWGHMICGSASRSGSRLCFAVS